MSTTDMPPEARAFLQLLNDRPYKTLRWKDVPIGATPDAERLGREGRQWLRDHNLIIYAYDEWQLTDEGRAVIADHLQAEKIAAELAKDEGTD